MTGTCPNLKKAKSKRVSTRGCRPAFVCIYGQGLARQKILPFQNYFVSLQSEIEYLTSSKMTPKRSVEHPRKYVYRMWGGCAAIDEIAGAMSALRHTQESVRRIM